MDAAKPRRKSKIKKMREAKLKPKSFDDEATLYALLDMVNALQDVGQFFTTMQASSKQNSYLMKDILERMKSDGGVGK